MNKNNNLLLSLALLGVLAGGCGGADGVLPEQTQAPTESRAPSSQTETPAEPALLGYAETPLLDSDEERVHNIRLAVSAIDEYELASGAEFSFNRVVGERTPERGYLDAPVIINREKQSDCGGGVCQVSTTIYQAAEQAGMTILERHSHQKEAGYAEAGRDAAVDYGNLDMRFVNEREKAVKIKVLLENGKVSAAVYEAG